MSRHFTRLLTLFVVASLGGIAQPNGRLSPDLPKKGSEKVDVIIQFNDPPRQQDHNEVQDQDGDSMPVNALEGLASNPRIKDVTRWVSSAPWGTSPVWGTSAFVQVASAMWGTRRAYGTSSGWGTETTEGSSVLWGTSCAVGTNTPEGESTSSSRSSKKPWGNNKTPSSTSECVYSAGADATSSDLHVMLNGQN